MEAVVASIAELKSNLDTIFKKQNNDVVELKAAHGELAKKVDKSHKEAGWDRREVGHASQAWDASQTR